MAREQEFKVLRFWNYDVLENRDGVLQKIMENLKSPSLTLPTRGREVFLTKHSVIITDTKELTKYF